MGRFKLKIRGGASSLKLGQRMILVFALGCFIPLILVYIYMYRTSSRELIDQQIKSGQESLDVQRELLTNKLNLVTELSERIYFDEERNQVVLNTYATDTEIYVDNKSSSVFDDYIFEYYRDISKISFYMNPDLIHGDELHFKKITDKIREKDWYKKTMQYIGRPRWSYYSNIQTGRRSLRLTRTLLDSKGREVGAISIELDPSITDEFINSRSDHALLVLNGTENVLANVSINESEIKEMCSKLQSADFNGWLTFHGEECASASVTISPRYSPDYYMLVLMQSYGGITKSSGRTTFRSLIPLMLAALMMAGSVLVLNRWFTRRITALGKAMHHVVERSSAAADGAIGEAHDEIWELYNDLNKMVVNMQQLSDTAANERIEREQLHSRNKDIEFKMLTTQINPHFLYNTLETMRMLAMINHQKDIEEISVMLNRLLRGSLEAGQELKTLAWEMDKVECYTKIQSYRFGDRITATVEYDKELAEKCKVMPFVVQPFVENAYVHAMEDKEADGLITIRAEVDHDLFLTVTDNGKGMSAEELEEVTRYLNDFENLDREHIGICNVNQRIKLRFGNEYGVTISSVENEGTTVQIRMPFVKCYGTENA